MEKLLAALFIVLLAAQAVIMYDTLAFDDRLPIEEWRTVEIINSPLKAGQSLKAVIHRTKVRDDCPVVSERQVISEDGVPYQLETAVSIGGASDIDHVVFEYPLPKNLPVGNYTLRVYLTYTCPEFVWPTQQPDARFRVIE